MSTKNLPNYQALMRQCRSLQAHPELIQRAFQEVAESSFDQGYEQGIQGQKECARAAFLAGYQAGKDGRTA